MHNVYVYSKAFERYQINNQPQIYVFVYNLRETKQTIIST